MKKILVIIIVCLIIASTAQASQSSDEFIKLFEIATMSDDVLIMCPGGINWRKLENAFYNKENQYSSKIKFLRELLIAEFNCILVNEEIN